ncbi:MAG: RNA polymerase sigma factor [Gemmatimonadota bacterium]
MPTGERSSDRAPLHHEDFILATACAGGDEGAWKEFEARHFGYIRAFSRRFDLSEEAAADVADGVIADLWQRGTIARFEGRSTLRTWLGAVVTHAALNAAARERRRASMNGSDRTASSATVREDAIPTGALDRFVISGTGGHDPAAREILSGAVASALHSLDPQDRLLVLLYYEQGLTLEQIGGLVGLSKATMSRRLERIRRGLQQGIERRLGAEGTSWSEIRPELDLSQLDLDLPALLSPLEAERLG